MTDDHDRGLYDKYSVRRVDGKDKGPYFVLAYSTDPHARVALEAYADSCADEYWPLAADLYAALGIDASATPAALSAEQSAYVAQQYPGQWVAIHDGVVVATGDSLKEAKAGSELWPGRMLMYIPTEGESDER